MDVQRKRYCKDYSHDHQGGRQDPGPVGVLDTRADGLVEGQKGVDILFLKMMLGERSLSNLGRSV